MQDSFENSAGCSNRARVDHIKTADGEHNRYCRYEAVYSKIEPEATILSLNREARGDQRGVHGVGKVKHTDRLLTVKSWLD